MKINLEDDIYLLSTERQWIIAKEETKINNQDGKPVKAMKHLTFHRTIEQALNSFLHSKLRKAKCTTIEGALKKIRELNEEGNKWVEHFKLKVD